MNSVRVIQYGHTKCYVIENQENSVLVDTDWAGTLPMFFKKMKAENIPLSSVAYLVITHYHPDHMGIAQDLVELGIQLIVFAEQTPYVHMPDSIFLKEKRTSFKPIDESKAMFLSCGESRAFFGDMGILGEALHTPGHSDDSISIVLDGGVAIVGDLCPLYAASAYNDDKIDKSWNKLLAHRLTRIYYGHSKEDEITGIYALEDVI